MPSPCSKEFLVEEEEEDYCRKEEELQAPASRQPAGWLKPSSTWGHEVSWVAVEGRQTRRGGWWWTLQRQKTDCEGGTALAALAAAAAE